MAKLIQEVNESVDQRDHQRFNNKTDKFTLGQNIRNEHLKIMANELQYLDEVPVEYIKQYFD